MPHKLTAAHLEQLKRRAKLLGREQSIPHCQALDRIALDYGFKNWSLLAKNASGPVHDGEAPPGLLVNDGHTKQPHAFTRSPAEMREATHVIRAARYQESSFQEALKLVEDICHRFASPANAIAFAINYMECLLTVPRFRIMGNTLAYPEMRCWLPYCVHEAGDNGAILVNRYYKPVGTTSREYVRYEDYPHLHFKVSEEALSSIAHKGSGSGYLFNDGCPPWWSRQMAEAYLERLRTLATFI